MLVINYKFCRMPPFRNLRQPGRTKQGLLNDAPSPPPAGETCRRAYQNDAVMLGRVLADDPEFVTALDRGGHMGTMKQPVAQIAKELNVSIMQVYSAQQILLYTSMPIRD